MLVFRGDRGFDRVVTQFEHFGDICGDDRRVFINRDDGIDRKLRGELFGLTGGAVGLREIEREKSSRILVGQSVPPFRSGNDVDVKFHRRIEESPRAVSRGRKKQKNTRHKWTILGTRASADSSCEKLDEQLPLPFESPFEESS